MEKEGQPVQEEPETSSEEEKEKSPHGTRKLARSVSTMFLPNEEGSNIYPQGLMAVSLFFLLELN